MDIERFNMNTAIAALMEEVNALQEWLNGKNDNAAVYGEAVENLLLLLSPFAPHIADELGSQLGFDKSFYQMSWPVADADVAKEDEVVIPVQVNGKLKARLTVEVGLANEVLEALALGNGDVAAAMEGKAGEESCGCAGAFGEYRGLGIDVGVWLWEWRRFGPLPSPPPCRERELLFGRRLRIELSSNVLDGAVFQLPSQLRIVTAALR